VLTAPALRHWRVKRAGGAAGGGALLDRWSDIKHQIPNFKSIFKI